MLKNDLIKIVDVIGTFTLKTGETVKQCKIVFWVEELGQCVEKGVTTFFPKEWSMEKIQQKILEATEDIVTFRKNKFVGRTKEGILIEFFIDLQTHEIQSAYIVLEVFK